MIDPAVTFTEKPDVLITAECQGLTISWLKGDDDDASTERQKQLATERLHADIRARDKQE